MTVEDSEKLLTRIALNFREEVTEKFLTLAGRTFFMGTSIKMIFLVIFSLSFFWTSSAYSEFRGCHQWCGNESNKAWCAVMESHEVSCTAPRELQEPFKAAADAAKNLKFRECMAQTIAEGKTSDADCNGEVALPSTVPTPGTNPNRCVSEYQNYLQQCEAQVSAAQNSCNESTNSALNSLTGGNTNTSGVTDACQQSANLSGSARDAWTSFKNACSSGIDSCLNKCAELVNWANSNDSCFPLSVNGQSITKSYLASSIYSPKTTQCMDLQAKVDTANNNISSYSSNASTSAECQAATSGGSGTGTASSKNSGMDLSSLAGILGQLAASTPKAEVTANAKTFCQMNPTYPGCGNPSAANCADPAQAATNKICICSLMPRDPQCMPGESSSSASNSMMALDSSSRLPSQAGDSFSPDLPKVDVDPAGMRPNSSGSAEGIDGRQGGAPVGNANVGSGLNPPGRAGASAGDAPPGAGGAGGFFGGGSGGGSGKGFASANGYVPGARNGAGGNPTTAVAPGNPDLRQFLPGGISDPRFRGLAGGVGQDGITGPHTNIWQKVQNRYRLLQNTLYP